MVALRPRRGALAALAALAVALWPRAGAAQGMSGTSEPEPARAPAPAGTAPAVQTVRVSGRTFLYTRPPHFAFLRNVPSNIARSTRAAGTRQGLVTLSAVGVSTAALIATDQRTYDATRRFGNAVGLPPSHPSWDIHIGPGKIQLPTTIASGMYFLGDGLLPVAISGGFSLYGHRRGDYRAMRTGSEILESLLSLAVFTQTGKHITGRQTPSEAKAPGGEWHFLPSWGAYAANVPAHDAFPSGHLASAMATVTVISMNYPEQRWVKPVGYSLMTVLSVAMVNNGVHWVGDYPLALAIGGVTAKVAVERGRMETGEGAGAGAPAAASPLGWLRQSELAPAATANGMGLQLVHRF